MDNVLGIGALILTFGFLLLFVLVLDQWYRTKGVDLLLERYYRRKVEGKSVNPNLMRRIMRDTHMTMDDLTRKLEVIEKRIWKMELIEKAIPDQEEFVQASFLPKDEVNEYGITSDQYIANMAELKRVERKE